MNTNTEHAENTQNQAARDVVIGIVIWIALTALFVLILLVDSLSGQTRVLQEHERYQLIASLVPMSFFVAWLLYRRWIDVRRVNRQLNASVTELNIIQETLRLSEASLANAQRIAHVGHFVWDERGDREIYCSEEGYRIFDVPHGTQCNFDTFLAAVHPDDRERVDAVMANKNFACGYCMRQPESQQKAIAGDASQEVTITCTESASHPRRVPAGLSRSSNAQERCQPHLINGFYGTKLTAEQRSYMESRSRTLQ